MTPVCISFEVIMVIPWVNWSNSLPMAVVVLLGFTNHINILEDNVDIYSYQYIYVYLGREKKKGYQ